jgi:hypothetical protein
MSDLTSRLVLLAALSIGGVSLAACSGEEIERDFGLSRTAPDEFTVTTRAPLSMPTSADLNKPVPGAERPQEQSSQTQALETLAPDVALRGAGGDTSAGQQALVADAAQSSAQAPTGGALDHPSQGFVNELMFWQGGKAGEIVDANAERQRLQENAALGRSPTVGATPTVKVSKPGFFERLF